MAIGEFNTPWRGNLSISQTANTSGGYMGSGITNGPWTQTLTTTATPPFTSTPAQAPPRPCEHFGRVGERDNAYDYCQCGFHLHEHPEFKERELLRMLLELREKLA